MGNKKITLVVTKDIMNEYIKVCNELSVKLRSNNINKILNLISLNSKLVRPKVIKKPVTPDKDDDKFIECALGSGSEIIISGDKHLLNLNGIYDIEILKPRIFLERYFKLSLSHY